MDCPQCGASNDARDSFCNACGYSFSSQMKIVRMDESNQPRPVRRRNQKNANNKFLAIWFSATVIIFLVIILLFKA